MTTPMQRLRVALATILGVAACVLIIVFVAQQAFWQPVQTAAPNDPTVAPTTIEPPELDPTDATAAPTSAPTFTPTPTPTPTAEPPPPTEPAQPQNELTRLLAEVVVVPTRPNVDGYDRDCGPGEGCVFGTAWSDDTNDQFGHNGCDTRNDVLRRALVDITIDADTNDCVVRTGTLLDPYTDRTISFLRGWDTSREIEVDHLIPLAAAWDLGAWKWSPEQRAEFSNDVEFELLAVYGPANQQKSDSTPASWLPSNKRFRCEYGVRYLRASLKWKLPITAADAEVLGHVARKCS